MIQMAWVWRRKMRLGGNLFEKALRGYHTYIHTYIPPMITTGGVTDVDISFVVILKGAMIAFGNALEINPN